MDNDCTVSVAFETVISCDFAAATAHFFLSTAWTTAGFRVSCVVRGYFLYYLHWHTATARLRKPKGSLKFRTIVIHVFHRIPIRRLSQTWIQGWLRIGKNGIAVQTFCRSPAWKKGWPF
jgi:hypothetical protein